MIRSDHLFEDMRVVLLAFFNSLGAPFTSWNFIREYPDKILFRKWDKPFIWVDGFTPIGQIESQFNYMGQRNVSGTNYDDYAYLAEIEFQISAWLNHLHGGSEEMNIIRSAIYELFNARKPGLPANQFNVALGSTNYTNTTLHQLGFRTLSMIGDREIPTEDDRQWRREMNIYSQILIGESIAI